uniref:Uncharacterized protein n=1 Tax=Rhizophora mucronata TaxID=61149 RepID=A0A2P2Q767_RHIMU
MYKEISRRKPPVVVFEDPRHLICSFNCLLWLLYPMLEVGTSSEKDCGWQQQGVQLEYRSGFKLIRAQS